MMNNRWTVPDVPSLMEKIIGEDNPSALAELAENGARLLAKEKPGLFNILIALLHTKKISNETMTGIALLFSLMTKEDRKVH